MIGVEFRGMFVHEPCGAEVVMVVLQPEDGEPTHSGQWGVPVLVDRLLRGRRLQMTFHQCRDYVDWHRSEPDRRDVNTLDLPDGWQPGSLQVRERSAA